jgi:hypothetical protein
VAARAGVLDVAGSPVRCGLRGGERERTAHRGKRNEVLNAEHVREPTWRSTVVTGQGSAGQRRAMSSEEPRAVLRFASCAYIRAWKLHSISA